MTFKVKSGINVGSIPIIDQDAKYQQVLATPNVKPTLNFDFLNNPSIDPRVTFTRSSSASVVDSNGLISYVANNVARFNYNPSTGAPRGLLIEGQGYNFFNASDIGAGAGGGTNLKEFTNTLIAPDGNQSGSIFASESSSNITKYWYRPAGTSTSNTYYTFSVFMKYIDEPYIFLRINDQTGGNGGVQGFNVQTGQLYGSSSGSVISTSITPYGNGWYRLQMTSYITAAISQIHGTFFLNAIGNTTAVSSVGVWGWQLEQSNSRSYAQSYIASADTFTSRASTASYRDSADGWIKYAPVNTARYQYNQAGRQSRLLLEYYTATNQITYSENLNNWSTGGGGLGGATAVANVAIAPTGTQIAYKLVEDTANTRHFAGTVASGSQTANTPITGSIFLKAAERTKAYVWVGMPGTPYTRAGVYIDLNTGVWSNNNSGSPQSVVRSVTPFANGWFRVMITTIADPTSTSAYIEVGTYNASNTLGYTGDNTSGMYVWGAQMEFSANGSSYIPTNGATATRAADVYTAVQTTRMSDNVNMNNSYWFNSNEGTFVSEFDSLNNGSSPFLLKGISEYITVRGVPNVGTWNGSTQIDSINVPNSNNVTGSSFAVAWNAAGRAMSLNGWTANTGPGTFVSNAGGWFQIGSDGAGNRAIDGHIKRLVYYPVAASNTQLQALSRLT